MPVPLPNSAPPFNIVRSSHVVLDVTDLDASRAFYERAIGLQVEDADGEAVYLRAMEERQHHSLALRSAAAPSCARMGFKVGSEADLDKAARYFDDAGCAAAFVDAPYQGRTLHVSDRFGFPLEFCATMETRERLLQQYGRYAGCHPQRFDHVNVFAPELQDAIDFYAGLGFRLTEYGEEDGEQGRIAAAWMHRKGSVHDIAFTNGAGPRLHHFAYYVPHAMNIVHLCDVMATTGYVKNIERGPGRHGISNAFFLYVTDPDGHRVEIYASDYMTIDPDHAPIRWSLRDPRRQTLWGAPAPRSWFEKGSVFPNQTPRPPLFVADVIIAD